MLPASGLREAVPCALPTNPSTQQARTASSERKVWSHTTPTSVCGVGHLVCSDGWHRSRFDAPLSSVDVDGPPRVSRPSRANKFKQLLGTGAKGQGGDRKTRQDGGRARREGGRAK